MKKPVTLEQFIQIITEEWHKPGRDLSDIGNYLGMKLAELDLDEAHNFVAGVNHGISLIDRVRYEK